MTSFVCFAIVGSSEHEETPCAVRSVHSAVLRPGKKKKDHVVCSDRSIPGGRKRSQPIVRVVMLECIQNASLSWTIILKRRKIDNDIFFQSVTLFNHLFYCYNYC